MQKVKIIGIASEICWWFNCVGQVCPVLEVYQPTGFIKIKVMITEKGFEDEPYEVKGWIEPQYIEEVFE